DQREEHAHSVPLRESPPVISLDFLPADSFDLLGVSLRAVASVILLCKVGLPGAPPGDVSVPTERMFVPPGIAPQEHATHHHLLRPEPMTPGVDEAQKIGRAVELGKAGLPESGMDDAPDRPGLILCGAVHVALRAVDLA